MILKVPSQSAKSGYYYWHPRFGGLQRHLSGHLKINQRGRFRYMHVHRAIAQVLLEEGDIPHLQWGRSLPADIVVHHMDFNPEHNCPQNLILMPWQLHSAMSWLWQERERGGKWARMTGRRMKPLRSETAPETGTLGARVTGFKS